MDEPIEHIRSHRRSQHALEQARALGRFVQAFEALVNMVRSNAINLSRIPWQERYPLVIMAHHTSMTAKPLFDVMRAIFHVASSKDGSGFNEEERDLFDTVMKQFATRYQDIVSKRNELLHGTWGSSGERTGVDDFEEAIVRKGIITATGFQSRKPVAYLRDLRRLEAECHALQHIMFTLPFLLHGQAHMARSVGDSFSKNEEGIWEATGTLFRWK